MSELGRHQDADPSMWNFSPVAGSLSGRGCYCARAGDATSVSAIVKPAKTYKRMACFVIGNQ